MLLHHHRRSAEPVVPVAIKGRTQAGTADLSVVAKNSDDNKHTIADLLPGQRRGGSSYHLIWLLDGAFH